MSNLITKTEKGPILLVWTVILFVSSFFMPFILVFLIHHSFYHSNSQWFFIAPTSAYITFMIGMFWIPIVLVFHLIIQYKYEIKHLKWFSILLLTLSIPFFMYGVSNFYYFDKNGFHYNYLKTLNETTNYEWVSFQEVKKIYVKDKATNTTFLDSYEFITKENKVIIIPYRVEFKENENRILEKLKENNVKVTDNFMEQYE